MIKRQIDFQSEMAYFHAKKKISICVFVYTERQQHAKARSHNKSLDTTVKFTDSKI